jgi:hypothetical protein
MDIYMNYTKPQIISNAQSAINGRTFKFLLCLEFFLILSINISACSFIVDMKSFRMLELNAGEMSRFLWCHFAPVLENKNEFDSI